MTTCRTCGAELGHLPYSCTYCDHQYCPDHRLPEDHLCIEFHYGGKEDSSGWFPDKFKRSNVRSTRRTTLDTDARERTEEDASGDRAQDSVEAYWERVDERSEDAEPHESSSDPSDSDSEYWNRNVSAGDSDAPDRPSSPKPIEDVDTYRGSSSSVEWKKEAHERDAGPGVAKDGSIKWKDDEPKLNAARPEPDDSLNWSGILVALVVCGVLISSAVYVAGEVDVNPSEWNIEGEISGLFAAGNSSDDNEVLGTDDQSQIATADDGASDDTDPPPELDIERVELQVVRAVNDYRASRGLSGLTRGHALSEAARAHSEDMIERNFFDHTNPDELESMERVHQFDANCIAVGENIAMTYFDELVEDPREHLTRHTDATDVAEGVVTQWEFSEGHRINMEQEDWTRIGVGVAIDGSEVYVTKKMCY